VYGIGFREIIIHQLTSNDPKPYTLLPYTPSLHPHPNFWKSRTLNSNPYTLSPDPWNPCTRVKYKYSLIVHQLTVHNPVSLSAINCSWTIDNCNWIPATHMWDMTHVCIILNRAITLNPTPCMNTENFYTPQTLNPEPIINQLTSNDEGTSDTTMTDFTTCTSSLNSKPEIQNNTSKPPNPQAYTPIKLYT